MNEREMSRRDFIKFWGISMVGSVAVGAGIGKVTKERTLSPIRVIGVETPKSEFIDGVEVYGHQNPLSQGELEKVMLNTYENTADMDPDTYYASFNFTKEFVDHFEEKENESVTSFIKRHADRLGYLLKEDPIIWPSASVTGGLKVRRVVIAKNNVVFPESRKEDYLSYGYKDSDGVWNFRGTSYLPEETSYFVKDENIDYGLLHEMGHSVLHLPDMYTLNYDPSDNHPVLEDVPKEQRRYLSTYRNDIGRGLMSSGRYLGFYEGLLLSQRRKKGKTHDFGFVIPEEGFFPLEVPKRTILSLGEKYKGAWFEVFRTEPLGVEHAERNKFLPTVPHIAGQVTSEGDLDMGYPFIGATLFERKGSSLIFPSSSIFLVKIYKGGELFTRWMDITDFTRAYWAGYTNSVTMHLKLFDRGNIAPLTFDWRVKYS